MFQINKDDLSIYATRGDAVYFNVAAELDEGDYAFRPGDVVRFKVYGKKKAEDVVLQRDFMAFEDTREVEIVLTKKDTKIGEPISKPKDYWYEVELNPESDMPQTIIGYDEDGAKLFRLFPEGDDIGEDEEITEEDISIVDSELDFGSKRPIENQAAARAVARLEGRCAELEERIKSLVATLLEVEE